MSAERALHALHENYSCTQRFTIFDYENASSAIGTKAMLSALADQGVDSSCVRALADCYATGCKSRIQLFHRPLPFLLGMREGCGRASSLPY